MALLIVNNVFRPDMAFQVVKKGNGLLFAGLGFVAMLPDFVGMGDGRGFQLICPCCHHCFCYSKMCWRLQPVGCHKMEVFTNDQLFITGYSQGGYYPWHCTNTWKNLLDLHL